jgi:hypothetical protein
MHKIVTVATLIGVFIALPIAQTSAQQKTSTSYGCSAAQLQDSKASACLAKNTPASVGRGSSFHVQCNKDGSRECCEVSGGVTLCEDLRKFTPPTMVVPPGQVAPPPPPRTVPPIQPPVTR